MSAEIKKTKRQIKQTQKYLCVVGYNTRYEKRKEKTLKRTHTFLIGNYENHMFAVTLCIYLHNTNIRLQI